MMTWARYILYILLLSLAQLVNAQVHISGIVRDSESGEVLIGANVFDPASLHGTSSDNNGYFSMALKEEIDSLWITYVGYTTGKISLFSVKDTILSISLVSGSSLEEVSITARRKLTFNQSTLSNEQLRYIPSIGGQPDVLKTLQLLPGVQSQNEGSSNLLVRGGSPDQNLFLIDNVSLFYVNHLGGFVSVFNPEVINDVRILKGGFPAKYGGKLSSVVDITMRDGNAKEFDGSAGIGVLGAHLTLEGPINDKVTYLFSGRKTFTEALLGFASLIQGEDYLVMYGFYDVNGKVTWRPDAKNSLQANMYLGDDAWSIRLFDREEEAGFINKWGNMMFSTHWKRILNSKSSVNNILSYTRYRMRDDRYFKSDRTTDTTDYFSKYRSSVSDVSLKSDWRYQVNGWYDIDAGLVSSFRSFIPNEFLENENEPSGIAEVINGLESALYLENKISASNWFHANIGIRATNYISSNYSDVFLEPRIDISFSLSGSQVLNASYMKGSQYSHMVFSSGNFLNNEVWIPTMEGMNPAKVDQYALGWKGQFCKNMFSSEVNLYYKNMEDLLSFKEGFSNLRGDALWRDKLEFGGIGKSYGAELFLSKDKGKYTGFLSYSYSHTTRQFDNINGGKTYVFEYDRPHSFSIDLHRKLSEKLVLNVLWVYQSGLPYTPAIARTYIPNTSSPEISYDYESLIYGERNTSRMLPYHRMDVSLYLKSKTVKGRNETWTFSIYNVYS
ncbi:MAG: TonB-dependent receptor plug domain-containing protein, partial [Bacteroidales bacterium]|nr:TonB-dependent receptor plug domain-containing protein [Bacteroidales bacterium]